MRSDIPLSPDRLHPLVGAAVLLLVLALCLPPLLIGVGGRDTTHTMENMALTSSQETWLRMHGTPDVAADAGAWRVPVLYGRPRLNKPPLVVWAHLLAWGDLTPANSTPELLVFRARLVAVGMALVLVAATCWAGRELGGSQVGMVAALAAGSMWFVERQGRTASYDIHMAAWCTLAVAAGIFAVAPLHAARSRLRFGVGWGLCGLSMALAFLSKGVIALPVVLLPLIAIIAAVPLRRRANWFGLALACAVLAMVITPWIWFVFVEAGGAAIVAHEVRAERNEFQPVFYYIAVFGLVLPWSIWLGAGLLHPFTGAAGERRRSMLLPWLWFIAIFVFFSIPGAKQQRYILPIVPAAAILIAQVYRDLQGWTDAGAADGRERVLVHVHWVGMALASIAAVPLLSGAIARGAVVPIAWWSAGAVGILLAGLALIGWCWQRAGGHVRAAVVTAVWAVALMSFYWHGYAHAGNGVHPVKAQAEAFATVVGDEQVRILILGGRDSALNEEFLFYSRRTPPCVDARELVSRHPHPRYVLALADDAHDQVMSHAGYAPVAEYQTDKRERHRLWLLSHGSTATGEHLDRDPPG